MLLRDIIDAAAARADVHEAADGQEALGFLRRTGAFAGAPRPDLVYLDIEMPGASGHDVLRAIRSDEDLRDIPVVMLTGLDDEAEKRRALLAGASGYVVKPAQPNRLLQAVAGSVRRWAGRPCGSTPGEAGPRSEGGQDDA